MKIIRLGDLNKRYFCSKEQTFTSSGGIGLGRDITAIVGKEDSWLNGEQSIIVEVVLERWEPIFYPTLTITSPTNSELHDSGLTPLR